jgi:hypothetical protein
MLTEIRTWDDFSNRTPTSGEGPQANSLEAIHDLIHLCV